MTNPSGFRTLVRAAVLFLPWLASAQDVSELAGLLNEPVVSTASKTAESAGTAPASTSIITSEDLKRYGFTTLSDAINFLGMGMQAEQSWGTVEVGARGVLLTGDNQNHVLLLIDGHAVNEPWDETMYLDQSAGIPLDLIDHVEVILGPGSVLYGSSAMLGVVNVITKRARDYEGLHLVADGGYPALMHLAGGFGHEFQVGERTGEVVAGLDLNQTWGPNETYGIQPYGDGTWGGDATHRSIGVPSGYLRVNLGDFQVFVRSSVSRRAATEIWGVFDDPDNWERDRFLSLDAKYSTRLSPSLSFMLRAYGDLYDYLDHAPQRDLDCYAGGSCLYQNYGTSRWAGAEANLTWDWFGNGNFVTLLGADGREIHIDSWSSYTDSTTGEVTTVGSYAPNAAMGATYLQQTAHLAEWLNLNAGLRLDAETHVVSHLSPRVAAVTSGWTGSTLKAIYSEAFRAPSFYERYFTDDVQQLAAPSLKPEQVRSVEAVLEQRAGTNLLHLSLYRSWWSDMVLEAGASQAQVDSAVAQGALPPGTTSAQIYQNVSSIDSYGMDVGWDGSAVSQRLRFGANATLAHSRQDGGLLAAAAQTFGNAHLSYDLGEGRPTIAIAARYTGPRPVSGTELSPVPDASPYLSLRVALSGPIAGGLSYRLAVTWSSANTGAYGVGPANDSLGYQQIATPASPSEILKVPQWQGLMGLRYDL